MQKLALFDFCDTLVGFQTADAFVDYVRKKDGNLYMKFLNLTLKVLIKLRIIAVSNKFFPSAGASKKIKLLQLKGFNIDKLNKLGEFFYIEMIKPKLITPVMEEMRGLAQRKYEVCIVSAGYSTYLKYFTEEYGIKHLISTEIAFDRRGKACLGRISGKDCMYAEKVNRIKAIFTDQDVNYEESISYSDSITDLPMLLLTGKGVVVSRDNSQSWSHQYKFKEIIWD
ncbi:MAG: HAD-IB family hydrolase [Bacteroidales bacterium]|nr:HAD-IB family hydrolase [Bacteroidales bacterium]MCF8390261.1 HAD-IB family hydrolase [Bacteroidales bacterium]